MEINLLDTYLEFEKKFTAETHITKFNLSLNSGTDAIKLRIKTKELNMGMK